MLRTLVVVPILLFCWCADVAARRIGANEQCVPGLALVAPPGADFGSIYLKLSPDGGGAVYRSGYLPSGLLVSIEQMPASSGSETRQKRCAFSYRGEISGFLDKTHVLPLAQYSQAGAGEVEAYVAPENPSENAKLVIYRDEKLSDIATQFGRADRPLIFLARTTSGEAGSALAVSYISNALASRPTLEKGFVRSEDDRANNPAGSYRVHRPYANAPPAARAAVLASWDWDSLYGYFARRTSETVTAVKSAFTSGARNVGEKVLGFASCQVPAELSISLKLGKSGLGIAAEAGGSLKWQKPANRVYQFTDIGERSDFTMHMAAIAACRESAPAYLEQAHLMSVKASEPYDFYIDRETFIGYMPEALQKDRGLRGSPNVATGRRVAQMAILPYHESTSGLYYRYFDSFQDYVVQDVLGRLPVQQDDQLAATLLLAEAVIHWMDRKQPR